MAENHLLNSRQYKILDRINADGGAYIRDLDEELGVSEATIRRDLDELARMGLIERVHGGATKVNGTAFERAHSEKMRLMTEEKRRIAAHAASLVKNGDSIFLDSGTTTYFIACELTRNKDLTILTNNLEILSSVQFDPTTSLIATGGVRREEYSVLIGSVAENTIRSFCLDKAFMGCDAISVKRGLYNTNFPEVSVKRCITRCGKKTILVTDSSKFYVEALAKICELSEIDMIITDKGLDEKTLNKVLKQVPNTVCV